MNRKRTQPLFLFAAAALVFLPCRPALACSWAMFGSTNTAVACRSMDWTNQEDDAEIRGIGRGVRQKTANTGNPLEYVTKYASIQIMSLGVGISDALNEKGLQGSALYLEGSRLPEPDPESSRHDMDPFLLLGYAMATCETVKEVIVSLGQFNFLPQIDPLNSGSKPSYDCPLHFAFADANGDNALVEFIDGKMVFYTGTGQLAVANEPARSAVQVLETMKYRPNHTINTIDRWARANQCLVDMRERDVDDMPRAIAAMRGVVASFFAGYTEIDPTWGETYHTQWWTVVDLKNPTYYLTRLDSWCSEIYDFSLFPREGFAGAIKPAADCPYRKISDGKERK